MSNFQELIGGEFLFYGISNYTFKLDDKIWEAVEDPNDGYRSCLEDIKLVNKGSVATGIYFQQPIAIVKVIESSEIHGYELVDVELPHTWLTFGTDNSDKYYPCFCFYYAPIPESMKRKPKNIPIKLPDMLDALFEPRDW